jgi:hypothetical protein
MSDVSEASGQFCKALADLAERLAARKFVVSRLEALFSHFGCWRLVVLRGHEAVQFFWDGREHEITVDVSPQQNYSAPNEWSRETEKRLQGGTDDSIRYVEEYLTKKYWEDYFQ